MFPQTVATGGLASLEWLLVYVLIAEAVLIGALFMGLVLQGQRQWREKKVVRRCRERVDALLERMRTRGAEAVSSDDLPRAPWRRRRLRAAIFSRLFASSGGQRSELARLYRKLGFVDDDYEQLHSRDWQRRLEAMRRIFLLCDTPPRNLIMGGLEDHPRIRLLCAHLIARYGSAEDLVQALNALDLPSNLMEPPIYTLLRAVDDRRLALLLASLDSLHDGRTRRAVMVMAAARQIPGTWEAMKVRRKSVDEQTRIALCWAAARYENPLAVEMLWDLLDDPCWEVRSQAAQALCEHSEPQALQPLAHAVNSPTFWKSRPLALEDNRAPTLDELCFFDDYLQSATSWVARIGQEQAQPHQTVSTYNAGTR